MPRIVGGRISTILLRMVWVRLDLGSFCFHFQVFPSAEACLYVTARDRRLPMVLETLLITSFPNNRLLFVDGIDFPFI